MAKAKGDASDPRGDDPPPADLVDKVNKAIDKELEEGK